MVALGRRSVHLDFPIGGQQISRAVLAWRRRQVGDTACSCDACRQCRASWPRYYCGSDERGRPGTWLSFECYLEVTEAERPEETVPRNAGWAAEEGLTLKRRRSRRPEAPAAMIAGCDLCGGLRPRGDRYCARCWSFARVVERITGRPAVQVLDPEHPEEWPAIRDAVVAGEWAESPELQMI